jgi:hypothetical protein
MQEGVTMPERTAGELSASDVEAFQRDGATSAEPNCWVGCLSEQVSGH